MANLYNQNNKFLHQPLKDDPDPELQSKIFAQAVQNECSAITAQALAALAAPETPAARRNRIAEGFAFALAEKAHGNQWTGEGLARWCLRMADEFIAELDQ